MNFFIKLFEFSAMYTLKQLPFHIFCTSTIAINDDTFCWRDYIHFIGKNKECWLHLPKDEKIGNIHIHKLFERIGI